MCPERAYALANILGVENENISKADDQFPVCLYRTAADRQHHHL